MVVLVEHVQGRHGWCGPAAQYSPRAPSLATGLVAVSTVYVPANRQVCGNARDLLLELYCERVVNPDTETRWSISYTSSGSDGRNGAWMSRDQVNNLES